MPDHLHPGVFIEEIERGPRPLEGVPTSTAALLGETERGSTTPRLVTSYKEYARWFGDAFDDTKYLPHSVSGFFENGGGRAVICRIVGSAARTSQAEFGAFVVRASGPGRWGDRVVAKIEPGTTKDGEGHSVGFRLRLAYWSGERPNVEDPFSSEVSAAPPPTLVEDFDDLVADESSPDFYGKRLPFIDTDKSGMVQGPESSALAVLVKKAGSPTGTLPADGLSALSEGADDEATPGVSDYAGLPTATGRMSEQGLAALERDSYREVSLVYAPAVSEEIAATIITHCEKRRFRFAVVDSRSGVTDTTELDPRTTIADSSYGAFYYPWLVTSNPRTGARLLVPPGGHILGVYARVDNERGVFKAPANEVVRGVHALEHDITDRIQDDLNAKGVNAIRAFPGRGIRVWGARTLAANALWKYVSARRLFIFLERSIDEGTQWAVFEPNDETLWARVSDTIRLFLRGQWRLGALLGATEEEAFFITCDRTTMTQDDILNGRLICEIGVAPIRPAEFVIFRLFQHTAEAQR